MTEPGLQFVWQTNLSTVNQTSFFKCSSDDSDKIQISSNFSISTLTSSDSENEGIMATATCASAHGIPIGQIWRTTISGATVTSGSNYYNGTFDAGA